VNGTTDGPPELPPVTLGSAGPDRSRGRKRRRRRMALGAGAVLASAALLALALAALARGPVDEVSLGPTRPTAPGSPATASRTPTATTATTAATTGATTARPTTTPTAVAAGSTPAAASRPKATQERQPAVNSADVTFTDPAPDGDTYISVPHCPRLKGQARVPSGYRLWFTTRYIGETRYNLLGPADTFKAVAGKPATWSKVVVLGGDDQFLKGTVTAVFIPEEWAAYLLSAYGSGGRPLIDSTRGDVTGFTTAGLPPHSKAVSTLKVKRAEGSRPCGQ